MKRQVPADVLLQLLMSYLHIDYIWGGSDPRVGLDCSGFTQDVFMCLGIDLPGDQNCQAFWAHMSRHGKDVTRYANLGDVAFFGKDDKSVTHMAPLVSPQYMIEAGGGGSTTRTHEEALARGARIRIRPLSHRSDLLKIWRPHELEVIWPLGSLPSTVLSALSPSSTPGSGKV